MIEKESIQHAYERSVLNETGETPKYTILDMGRSYKLSIEIEGSDGRPTKELPRYAVWRMSGSIAKEVVYTSNNLKMLQKKFNVDDKYVYKMR